MSGEDKGKQGWELTHDLFEVYWKLDNRGKLYADRVRVCGTTFYYCGTGRRPSAGNWQKTRKTRREA